MTCGCWHEDEGVHLSRRQNLSHMSAVNRVPATSWMNLEVNSFQSLQGRAQHCQHLGFGCKGSRQRTQRRHTAWTSDASTPGGSNFLSFKAAAFVVNGYVAIENGYTNLHVSGKKSLYLDLLSIAGKPDHD